MIPYDDRSVKEVGTIRIPKELRRRLLSLAVPIALQQVLLAAVGAGDSLMLGLIDGDAMAAVSLAANIEFIENLFLSALVGGATILSAQYWGKNDRAAIERVFGLILRYAAVFSVAFAGAALLCPEALMRLFTGEAALIAHGAAYLRRASGAYLLTGITQCYLCIMKATGQTHRSVVISSSALVLDTVLNAVFILAFRMGAAGAALTTTISRAVELVLVLALSPRMAVRPRLFSRPSSALHRDFLHCSVPHLINSLLWGLGTTLYTVVVGHLGVAIATAYSAAAVVRKLSLSLCLGLGQGAEIVLAETLGAGKLELGRRLGRYLCRFSVACGVTCAALVLVFGPLLSHVLSLTEAARTLFHPMILISAGYMLPQCVNIVVVCGIFAAGGDTAFDAYSVAVTMWLIILPLAFAAAFWWHWPPLAVYGVLALDEAVKVPWICIHYRKYHWLNNITREEVVS